MKTVGKKAKNANVKRAKKSNPPKKRTGPKTMSPDDKLKHSIDAQLKSKNKNTNTASKITEPSKPAPIKTTPNKATTKLKRSDNRHVIVEVDTAGKPINTYLDLGHAATAKGLKAEDIKNDMIRQTQETGIWLRIPVGDSLDMNIIEEKAQEFYKNFVERVETKKKGRGKPVNREEFTKKIKSLDVNSIDDKTLRQVEKILAKAHS